MADEQEQRPQRRFSWSYIFSFLLIVGIIVTVIVLLFGGNKTTTLTKDQFISALGNNRITEITETPKENTLVSIEGYYSPANVTKPTSRKFKVVFSYTEYYEQETPYFYVADADKTYHYLVDNSAVADVAALDAAKTTSLASYILDKATKAATADKPTFVLHLHST